MEKYIIHTDGSCNGNPGPGGWAVTIRNGKNHLEMTGFVSRSTNNRMELIAVINGLMAVAPHSDVILFTDSKYIFEAFNSGRILVWLTNGWKKIKLESSIENKDLWQELILLTKRKNLTVEYRKTKAHKHDRNNNKVDILARKTAKQELEPYTVVYTV